jgi:hypothetical protein
MKEFLIFLATFLSFCSLSFSQPTIVWQKCLGGSKSDGACFDRNKAAELGYTQACNFIKRVL